MATTVEIAFGRQQRLSSVTAAARARAARAWQQMDPRDLDASWQQVGPVVADQVVAAQSVLATGSDRYTAQAAAAQSFVSPRSSIVPQAFLGVDGAGRDIGGTLLGAVTTTKTAIGTGLGTEQSLLAGASYLAAMVKTLIADAGRSADNVSANARKFTHWVRVVGGQGCSRCAILAGIASAEVAFKRHINCECTAMPVVRIEKLAKGLHTSPEAYFESLSTEEQDRIFTKAGAQSIRDGADITKVVNARRGANGIGYPGQSAGARLPGTPRGVFTKTTIGYRANGEAVQVYTTAEATTVRGSFGRDQLQFSETRKAAGARYTSVNRVRLMPESIIEIAGPDIELRQAFLRDAGYIDYQSRVGWSDVSAARADIQAQRQADHILVDRATSRFANFYLG